MKLVDISNGATAHHFVLVYGESGTGKTHLCGTLGDAGRVLVIDCDEGFDTLACASTLSTARSNLTVASLGAFRDLDTVYKAVKANTPAAYSKLLGCEITQLFDWVVWDNWSALQFTMLEELRKSKGVGAFEGSLGYRKVIDLQHWGILSDFNKLCVLELRKCAVHQAFIMQESVTKDELTGAIAGGPAIQGKLMQEVPAMFGTVIRTTTGAGGAFAATTKHKGKYPAKSRRKAGEDYTAPHMCAILDLERVTEPSGKPRPPARAGV